MSAISPKKSPKREVVDLTDESDADTKSPTKSVLGKRPAQSEPELQSPTKTTKTEDDSEPLGFPDLDNKAVDCAGCVVIMGMHDDLEAYVWLKVPEDQFHKDLRVLAKRYNYKGDCMLHYLRQANCIPSNESDEEDDDDEEVGGVLKEDEDDDDDAEEAKDKKPQKPKQTEGSAMIRLFEYWAGLGYDIPYSLPRKQLTNVKHFVSVYISE